MKSQLIILDFGSQYTQLIARAVRELGIYCEIIAGTHTCAEVLAKDPKAIILSGSPCSVREEGAPIIDSGILRAGIPVLGICYGMQSIAHVLGGELKAWGDEGTGINESHSREYGRADLLIEKNEGIFASFSAGQQIPVWMSHGDKVVKPPVGFEIFASSKGAAIAAFGDKRRKLYGVQFHPEVHHTPQGKEILSEFLFSVAGLERDWDPENFISETIDRISSQVSSGNVVCGLSGGVDSAVAAVLVNRAIGDRLHCIFVDNGLLREDEQDEVMDGMRSLGLNVHMVDASERFLSELEGVSDPEKKRKIIGRVFIEVFEAEANRISDVNYLVQGTLYPDVIESVSVVGKSQTIKSHHNVGGLTDNMKLGLIEPLRELFKDEVRAIGRELGIAEKFISRQPFPGPGLAVRCLGEVTRDKIAIVRRADAIVREEVEKAGLNEVIWQSFAVLLPVHSVGVMGDGRTFDQAIAIRAVTSRDGMTADWFMFPEDVLRQMATRVINETPGVNRVVLDVSTKPPATIEWE